MADQQRLDEMLAEKLAPDVVQALAEVQGVSVEVKATTEDPVARAARLRREERDASIERMRHVVLFLVAVSGIVIFAGFCIYVLVTPGFSADDKKWAQTVVSALVAGCAGYTFGRHQAQVK